MAYIDKFLFRITPAPSETNNALTEWNGYLDDINEQIVIFDNTLNAELFRIGGGSLPFGNDTGIVNAYQTAISGASLTDGYAFEIKIANTNTAASTLQVNALGVLPLIDVNGDPLVAGMVEANSIYIIAYNSSFNSYQLLGESKPDVAITNNVIPKGTGLSINDGSWQFSGNDIMPTTTGSNIGDATHRIGTIFMASSFDYASDLTWNSGVERMRLTTAGFLGIGGTPSFKLDVFGPINTDNGFWHNGNRLLQSDTVTPGNAFVGSYSFNSTPGSTGIWINAYGYNAAQNQTGDYVNVMGAFSAQSNVGSLINGMGWEVLQGNSGGDVQAFGYQTAKNNTGNRILAFGTRAAFAGTISNAIFFGRSEAATNGYLEGWVGVGPDKAGTEAMHAFTWRQGSIAAGVADTGMSGVDLILAGAVGTGTGVGGDVKIKVAPAGGAGAAQNALVDTIIFKQNGYINLPLIPSSGTGFPPGGTVSKDIWIDTLDNTIKIVP